MILKSTVYFIQKYDFCCQNQPYLSEKIQHRFAEKSPISTKTTGRGEVEDTRLEAKAKDTNKIRGQGQGQPFRGQTLSRPRTLMLEAKAKDQGHKRKCSPRKKNKGLHKNFSGNLKEKKGLHKNFSGDLHKKNVFQKNFSSASQNFNNSKNRVVLEPKTGQFSRTSGLEAKAKDFKMCPRQLEIGGNIGRVDRASAAETVDWSSIPGRVKPKTIKIGIHKLPFLTFSN